MRPSGLLADGGMFRVPYDSYFSHFFDKKFENFKFSGNARSVHFFKNLFFLQIFFQYFFQKIIFSVFLQLHVFSPNIFLQIFIVILFKHISR